eukprot:5627550-Pyramimonas_sp.AAC.1
MHRGRWVARRPWPLEVDIRRVIPPHLHALTGSRVSRRAKCTETNGNVADATFLAEPDNCIETRGNLAANAACTPGLRSALRAPKGPKGPS